jgi:ribosomal protein S2
MKLKKIKHKKYKILKLHLLKSQVYQVDLKNDNYNEFVNKSLEQSELHVKKALKIVYEYHCNNLKILFVGLPNVKNRFFRDLLRSTQHFFIPSNVWVNSFLANHASIFRFLKLKQSVKNSASKKNLSLKNINTLLSVRTKPDLVVIFNQDIKTDIIKELFNLDIPIILFGSNVSFNSQITYAIPGNFFFVNQKVTNIFFCLLCSILKNRPVKDRTTIV